MARSFRLKKPNMNVVWMEITMLAIWLFFGERIINVLEQLVTTDEAYANNTVYNEDCINGTLFEDAWEFLGFGNTCEVPHVNTSNTSNGLLGIVALIMVVAVIMNFISYK